MTLMPGTFIDGKPAQTLTLKNQNGMSISVMDMGATWLSCLVPLKKVPLTKEPISNKSDEVELREILLATNHMEDHLKQTAYMGATIGRVANRIAKGRFTLDNVEYQLPINNGENCLHGGIDGFSHRRWQVEKATESKVLFSLMSADGDQGFPGELMVTVEYELTEANEVVICYGAKTNKATPVNLTNHAYFNLMGANEGVNCLNHKLQINSDYYLQIFDDLIPTGQRLPVDNTGFDFRQLKIIEQDFLKGKDQQIASGYDHAFITNHGNDAFAAKLVSPDNKVTLQMQTSQPALHVYTGNFLKGNPAKRQNSQNQTEYQNYAGVALETEYFPDSPNNEQFPNCVLQPNENYLEKTVYAFSFF